MSKGKQAKEKKHDEIVIGMEAGLNLNKYGFDVIEPGIRKLVRVLHNFGFKTICSCAGHTNALEPLPWVGILASPEMLSEKNLVRLACCVGLFNLSKGKNGSLPKAADTWVLSPQFVGGKLIFYLRPQSLNERNDLQEIHRLRELGEELSSFLLPILY